MWEYQVMKINSFFMAKAILDEYGKAGWELVGIFEINGYQCAVFKRPKE